MGRDDRKPDGLAGTLTLALPNWSAGGQFRSFAKVGCSFSRSISSNANLKWRKEFISIRGKRIAGGIVRHSLKSLFPFPSLACHSDQIDQTNRYGFREIDQRLAKLSGYLAVRNLL
jgi:hypothetical protein